MALEFDSQANYFKKVPAPFNIENYESGLRRIEKIYGSN